MKIWKRIVTLLIFSALLPMLLSIPASAEGFTFNWDSDDNEGPHCKSLFMLNLDTDTVVYTHNPDEELPMASMTKIMTYIVAYETIPDIENTVITVPQSVEDELEGTGSSLAEIQVGEELTGLQLLYLMMVPSGNDAALTLAKYVDTLYETGQIGNGEDGASQTGTAHTVSQAPTAKPESSVPAPDGEDSSEDGGEGDGDDEGPSPDDEDYTIDYSQSSYFVQLMNRKAAELGCPHTHFTNPHGLHHKNHYSTAREMAIMTKYAMALPNFTEITSTPAYVKPATNLGEETTQYTTNKLLSEGVDVNGISYYYSSATGVKTGSHNQAGFCLTATATAYGYTYIAVAMGDMEGYETNVHYEMLDIRSLFRWAVSSLEKRTVAAQGDVMSTVGLKYAWRKDTLQLVANETVSVMLPSDVSATSILVTPNVPENVEAPIRKGEQIGTATLSYAGEVIATVPLVSAESVERSEAIHVWEQGQAVLTSPWFLVIMAVIAALVIVYIILIVLYRRKQRQLRKVRRFRDM